MTCSWSQVEVAATGDGRWTMARALVEFAPRRRQLTVDEDTGNKNQKAQRIPLQQVKRWMEGQWTEGGSLSTRFMQIVALSVRSSSTLRFAAVRFLTICSRSVFIRRWLPLGISVTSVSVRVPYAKPTNHLRTHDNAEVRGDLTGRLLSSSPKQERRFTSEHGQNGSGSFSWRHVSPPASLHRRVRFLASAALMFGLTVSEASTIASAMRRIVVRDQSSLLLSR